MLYLILLTSLLVWSKTQQICHKSASLRQLMTVIKPFPFHPETNPQSVTPVGSGWCSTLLAGGAILILLLAELTITPAALSSCSQGTKPTTRRASIQLNTAVGSILFITSRARSTRYKMKKKVSWLFSLPSASSSVPIACTARHVTLRPLHWISGSCLYHIYTVPEFGLRSPPQATERVWGEPK